MGICGLLWESVGCCGDLWVAVGICELLWGSVGCSGNLWVAVGICGLLWESCRALPFPQSRSQTTCQFKLGLWESKFSALLLINVKLHWTPRDFEPLHRKTSEDKGALLTTPWKPWAANLHQPIEILPKLRKQIAIWNFQWEIVCSCRVREGNRKSG